MRNLDTTTSSSPADAEEPELQAGDAFLARLPQLLLLTSIFSINFLSRVVLAPLMPKVKADLAISNAEAGSLFLLISLGYFTTLLASGFISSRLAHRRTIISSSIASGLAMIFISIGTELWQMRLGLIALGLAAGPYLPSGLATITTLIKPRNWGKAIAIHEMAPNMSFVVAPVIAEVFLLWFSWRTVFLVLGISAMLLALVYSRLGRGGDFCGEALGYSSVKQILSRPSFWIMVALFSLGISSTLGIYTMLPLYLVTDHAMARNWANTLIAFSRIAGIGLALVGGWASDYFGPKRILRLVLALTGMMTIFIGLASPSWIAVAVFLQPVMAVCFFPAALALLSMVSTNRERSVMISLTIPVAFLLGGGGAPALIGFVGDVSSFGLGIALVGSLIMAGAIFSGFLRI
jgi:NNP family nitrate/nitrite transporter-like MFS transporter